MKNNILVGHCPGGGPVIRGLVAAAALLFSVNVSATLVLDNFKDGTRVEANNQSLCAEANSSQDPTSIIIGTQRDMSILNAVGRVTMDSFFAGLLIIEQENQAGEITLQWDGVDSDGSNTSPCNLNHTGLGGVDLTQGGAVRKLHIMVSSTSPNNTQINIRIYTDATHWSSSELVVNTDQIASYVIDHNDDFTRGVGANGPVNFANVGAIEMQILVPTGRVSISFDLIETSVTLGESSVQVVPPIGGLPGGLMFKWNTLEEFKNAGFIVGQRRVGQRRAGGDDDDWEWEPLSGFMEADNLSGATYHAFVRSDPCTDCEYGIADIDTDGNVTIHVIK